MSHLSSKLDLAERLLALTVNPFETEARTAAFKLAEHIRRHGLAIVDPSAVPPPKSTPEPEMKDRVILVSKFPGRCKACTRKYHPGDEIAWARGRGSICFFCFEEGREP
mgnify:CR=1 FL=1